MRIRLLGSIALLLVSAGLAGAQPEPAGPNGGPTWVSAEYLLWFFDQPRPQPLVTTSPASSFGILGQPGTVALIGGTDGGERSFNGARIRAGHWFTGMCAWEASAFMLGQESLTKTVSSNAAGTPVLARPIFNVLANQEDVHLVAFPGAFAGSVTASLSTRLWGGEANLIYNPYHSTGNFPEWIVGFRFVEMHDQLDISDNTTILARGSSNFGGVAVFAPNGLNTTDHFGTRSQFYGGQVGVRSRFEFLDCLYLSLEGKLAIGDTHQVVNLNGNTTLVPPAGASRTISSGLQALSTNIGRVTRDDLSFLPEANISFGCWITPCVRVFTGFNAIYWSDVARAGDQVTHQVNVTLDPRSNVFGRQAGAQAPGFVIKDRDFWTYGLTTGLALEF